MKINIQNWEVSFSETKWKKKWFDELVLYLRLVQQQQREGEKKAPCQQSQNGSMVVSHLLVCIYLYGFVHTLNTWKPWLIEMLPVIAIVNPY